MPLAKLDAFEPDTVNLAEFAKALSHPARIEILRLLAVPGEHPCMEIVRNLPLSQPACSRHINELLRTGLISSRTQGSNVFYKLDKAVLLRFGAALRKILHI